MCLYWVTARPVGWDTLRLAVFLGTWIRLGVSGLRWQSVEVIWHGFRETGIHSTRAKSSVLWASEGRTQALALFGEDRFIAGRLRCSFLGEHRLRSSHFLNRWGLWTTVLRLFPSIKKGHVPYLRILGRSTNTVIACGFLWQINQIKSKVCSGYSCGIDRQIVQSSWEKTWVEWLLVVFCGQSFTNEGRAN